MNQVHVGIRKTKEWRGKDLLQNIPDETRACLDYRGRLANNWREFSNLRQKVEKRNGGEKKNELLRSMNPTES